MRVVVTGATSFIGYEFIKATVAKGWDVVAVIRKDSSKRSILNSLNGINVVELNMDKYMQIGNMVGKCDCFVHFAWNGTRGVERTSVELQAENYQNSVNAIRSIISVGCKRIIIAGSQAEYGPCMGTIEETMPCTPNTQYGIYKYKLYEEAKKICKEYSVSFKEPRFFSLYGPGDFSKTLIMSMIDNMRKNNLCELTECIQLWDFLYISDAIEAVIGLCEKDCLDGAYNLGSGDTRQLKEYVEELKKILHSESALNYGAVPYPKTGMVSICPSITKICKELNWKAKTSFEEGIKNILDN